jgi:hypothetical protein
MLTGKALLTEVAKLSKEGLSKSAQAKACGYTRTVGAGEKAGLSVTDVHKFLEALVEAQGIEFGVSRGGFRPRGWVTVGSGGNAVIGKTHLRQLGIEPGARLNVQVDEETQEVVLSALAA